MPRIQAPAIAERLRRKFEIAGSSDIDTIAPELVGVIIVDDVLPQLGSNEGALSQTVTGDTGDIPEVGIRNTDPNRSCVIDRIQMVTSNAGVRCKLRLGPPGGTILAAAIGTPTDFRGQTLTSALLAHSASNFNTVTGAGTIIWDMTMLANVPHEVMVPKIVLAPFGTIVGVNVVRDSIHMDIQSAASILRVTWSFHFIEPLPAGQTVV